MDEKKKYILPLPNESINIEMNEKKLKNIEQPPIIPIINVQGDDNKEKKKKSLKK